MAGRQQSAGVQIEQFNFESLETERIQPVVYFGDALSGRFSDKRWLSLASNRTDLEREDEWLSLSSASSGRTSEQRTGAFTDLRSKLSTDLETELKLIL